MQMIKTDWRLLDVLQSILRGWMKRSAAAVGASVVVSLGASGGSAAEGSAADKAEAAAGAAVSQTGTSVCALTTKMGVKALFAELKDVKNLPVVHKDGLYVALQDKATFAMWTFTREGQSAHPAVVCRVPVRDGDNITLTMVINCEGAARACQSLKSDFQQLNQRMQLQIENQQSGR